MLNAGSSSLKFKLFDTEPFRATIGGLVERIGDVVNSRVTAKETGSTEARKWTEPVPVPDHVAGMEQIMTFLTDKLSANIHKEVLAVGHRIVHGLDMHTAVPLTDEVIQKIQTAATLAPLHNPPGLQGIQAAKQVFKGVPQVRTLGVGFGMCAIAAC